MRVDNDLQKLKQCLRHYKCDFEVLILKNKRHVYSYFSGKNEFRIYFDYITEFALTKNPNFFYWSFVWYGNKHQSTFLHRQPSQNNTYKEGITVIRKHKNINLLFSIGCLKNEHSFYQLTESYIRIIDLSISVFIQLFEQNKIDLLDQLMKELSNSSVCAT